MELTEQELLFLASQRLSVDDVLDARRPSSRDRKQVAKEQGKVLILGTPCEKYGHRLRTRAGHCVQCDSSKIAYQRRHSALGYVYIAGSLASRPIKVGGTESIHGREDSLCKERYAGACDWKMLFYVKVVNYGQIESDTLTILAKYGAKRFYYKGIKQQYAWEAFECSFTVARSALRQAMNSIQPLDEQDYPRWRNYEFS